MNHVELHTDGACIGNPGPGGFGAVVKIGVARRELSGGFRTTTNNRMEIYAAIAALRALDGPSSGMLFSDSRYVVDAIEKKWAVGWRSRGWMRTKKERAVNDDLWSALLDLLEPHAIRFQWVRGHAGNRENEACDRLANAAARRGGWPADEGYERATRTSARGLFDA